MTEPTFTTSSGHRVPAVTANEMQQIDEIAVEELGLGILQMMEHAGRNLAELAMDLYGDGPVVILAGAGGNGGGGLCCARHLSNRGVPVRVILDRDPDTHQGASKTHLGILGEMPVPIETAGVTEEMLAAELVIDALIGYGLQGEPRDRAAEIIEMTRDDTSTILSLDVPSGLNATSGETPGVSITPDTTLTLALPKTGLVGIPGELMLGDIGIPSTVYHRLDIRYESPFTRNYVLPLIRPTKNSSIE